VKDNANSTTRIYLQGNEDVARWHLPVALSKFKAFVERCKKAGLKQDTFSMVFDEDSTMVFGQYFYGSENLQISSPVKSVVIEERSSFDLSVEVGPKTFWVNTTQGYFWVEVRYDDEGLPVVTLTPFVAKAVGDDGISEEFIYPGMGMQSFGMLTGCLGGISSQRYVLTQSGGVMVGEDEEKGTIKLPGTGSGNARITVNRNDIGSGFFCVLENDSGKVAQVKVISVDLLADELVIEMQHGSIDMLVEAESGNITSENFPKTPTYVHRKCVGSYFSPNKTIGYHVDAGSDDGYHGNTFAIPPGAQDKLDNGMEGESYFNHSKDLYGIASLFAVPLEFSKTSVSLVMVSPTLVWEVLEHDDLCWGGEGETQTYAGCIDLRGDFLRNIISPRFCKVDLIFESQLITVFDLSGTSNTNLHSVEIEIDSWCGKFGATAASIAETQCGPKYFYEDTEEGDITDPCSWNEDGTGICDVVIGGSYFIEYAKEVSYRQHWVKNFRENLNIKRKVEFRFGRRSLISSPTYRHTNPYFLFDGLWHADFGVMWLTNPGLTNTCKLCADPLFSQVPGELVYFKYSGSVDQEWLLNHGREYVRNLEIIEPLGMHNMPNSSDAGWGIQLGFITRVPEELAAPHEPEVLTGGVSYSSEDAEGEIVNCEYSLMSAPCLCDTPVTWGQYSEDIILDGTAHMYFDGGCPPFSWTGNNVSFVNSDGVEIDRDTLKKTRNLYVRSDDECSGSVKVYEVCGGNLSKAKSILGYSGSIAGPNSLEPGETAIFYHDLGPGAAYSGSLPGTTFENELGNGIVATMPGNATGEYSVIFAGPCGSSAEMTVQTGIPNSCAATSYTNGDWHNFGTPWPGIGEYVFVPTSGLDYIFRIGARGQRQFGGASSWELGEWSFTFTYGFRYKEPDTGELRLYGAIAC
jgi:hypothetical protein